MDYGHNTELRERKRRWHHKHKQWSFNMFRTSRRANMYPMHALHISLSEQPQHQPTPAACNRLGHSSIPASASAASITGQQPAVANHQSPFSNQLAANSLQLGSQQPAPSKPATSPNTRQHTANTLQPAATSQQPHTHTHMHAHIRTCTHAHAHAYILTNLHTYIHTFWHPTCLSPTAKHMSTLGLKS